MKSSTKVILGLSLALLGTNVFWAYRLFDAGISYTYQQASLEDAQQALAQSVAVVRTLTPAGNRSQIISAAQSAWASGEPFEKDGFLWVGRIGLRFDDAGRLTALTLTTD
jgi:hypothetical protein